MKKGIATIAIIGIITPFLLAGFGYLISLRNTHEADVRDIKIDLSEKGEVISALEANVGNLKEDTTVIKADIKELLQRIPKR